MNHNLQNVIFLNEASFIDYNNFLNQSTIRPFSKEVISYLSALSKELNNDSRLKEYPDVATFSFYCRKANVMKLKKEFHNDDNIKLGRGTIFHIAPSNVPINFAFSMILGLLAGNNNIIRVPSANFAQVNIIIDAINKLSEDSNHSFISKKIMLVSYDRDDKATEQFSLDCDIRVIWGGDETIRKIRLNNLKPRAYDITFADRYSMCTINADQFIKLNDHHKVANGFYNDTYLFDQNACTSPHLIFWIGSKNHIEKSKKIFWSSLYKIVLEKYDLQPVAAVNKLTKSYEQAIKMDQIQIENKKDNYIFRVCLKELDNRVDSFRCDSGYFLEYNAKSLNELSKILNNKYQTLSYYGFEKDELSKMIKELEPSGIDRITPIGMTMDFSLIWDGYNVIEAMSRSIEII